MACFRTDTVFLLVDECFKYTLVDLLLVGGSIPQLLVDDLLAELVGQARVLLQVGQEQADVLCRGLVLEHVVDAPLASARRLVQTLGGAFCGGEPFVEEVADERVLDANGSLAQEGAGHLAQQEEAVFLVGPLDAQLAHQLERLPIFLVVVRLSLELATTFLQQQSIGFKDISHLQCNDDVKVSDIHNILDSLDNTQ